MPAKRKTKGPKSYGRQADGKTIKSVALDASLVAWSASQARAAGLSFSAWMNEVLRKEKQASRGKASKPAKKK